MGLTMRAWGAILVLGLCLTACSRTGAPPVGRWQGSYNTGDTMIVARLEIDPKGGIFLSAPDATDIDESADRAAIRTRLRTQLETEWGVVTPRTMDFDGQTFRKPGGVAPQLEWDPASGQMTAYIYLGMKPALRVGLHPVKTFDDDPWKT